MTDRLDLLDYYTLLQVDPGATLDGIREAYHRFAMKYHPDRHLGHSEERIARAAQIFRRGAEAYRVLTDGGQRRLYDEALAKGELRLSLEDLEHQSDSRPRRKKGDVPLPVQARPFLDKALASLEAGNPQQAKLHLNIAFQHAPKHPKLMEVMKQAVIAARKR